MQTVEGSSVCLLRNLPTEWCLALMWALDVEAWVSWPCTDLSFPPGPDQGASQLPAGHRCVHDGRGWHPGQGLLGVQGAVSAGWWAVPPPASAGLGSWGGMAEVGFTPLVNFDHYLPSPQSGGASRGSSSPLCLLSVQVLVAVVHAIVTHLLCTRPSAWSLGIGHPEENHFSVPGPLPTWCTIGQSVVSGER
jgi:hypothetical protein